MTKNRDERSFSRARNEFPRRGTSVFADETTGHPRAVEKILEPLVDPSPREHVRDAYSQKDGDKPEDDLGSDVEAGSNHAGIAHESDRFEAESREGRKATEKSDDEEVTGVAMEPGCLFGKGSEDSDEEATQNIHNEGSHRKDRTLIGSTNPHRQTVAGHGSEESSGPDDE